MRQLELWDTFTVTCHIAPMAYLCYQHSAYLSANPETSESAIICACALCPSVHVVIFTARHADSLFLRAIDSFQVCEKALVKGQGGKV